MREHISTVHEKIRPYMCPICNKSFGQKSSLPGHIASVHEGKRPYACKVYDKHFVAKQGLQKHEATVHEGKRPYECKNCDKCFEAKQDLKIHISKVHSRKKPNKQVWNALIMSKRVKIKKQVFDLALAFDQSESSEIFSGIKCKKKA